MVWCIFKIHISIHIYLNLFEHRAHLMKKLWDIYPGKKSLHNGNDYKIITQEAHDREICRDSRVAALSIKTCKSFIVFFPQQEHHFRCCLNVFWHL